LFIALHRLCNPNGYFGGSTSKLQYMYHRSPSNWRSMVILSVTERKYEVVLILANNTNMNPYSIKFETSLKYFKWLISGTFRCIHMVRYQIANVHQLLLVVGPIIRLFVCTMSVKPQPSRPPGRPRESSFRGEGTPHNQPYRQ